MKGIIALDIDGTITAEKHSCPLEVIQYLTFLANQGWKLIFITGRSYMWAQKALALMPFDYYLAVQNGAIILEMPSKNIVYKRYLPKSILSDVKSLSSRESSDVVIYGGFEYQDICYYRPDAFEKKMLDYVEQRKEALKENWIKISTFEECPLDSFPSIKSFGLFDSAKRIASFFENSINLHAPIVRDPFNSDYFVIQATCQEVNKGQALTDFICRFPSVPCVIAGGDDENDIPMLKLADIRVVMETAPRQVQELAHILAPSADKMGIIAGLSEAVMR